MPEGSAPAPVRRDVAQQTCVIGALAPAPLAGDLYRAGVRGVEGVHRVGDLPGLEATPVHLRQRHDATVTPAGTWLPGRAGPRGRGGPLTVGGAHRARRRTT